MTERPNADALLSKPPRDCMAVLKQAQELLYAGRAGDPETTYRVIAELDAITAALAVLPDLHEQAGRRLAVLFPGAPDA